MKNDNVQKSFLVIGLVLMTVLATTIIASADDSSTVKQLRQKFMNYSGDRQAHHEEMKEILENQDYEAFLNMDVPEQMVERHTSITQDQFNVIVEAHKLRETGDFQGAREILEDSGLTLPMGNKGMKGRNGFKGQGENREAMKSILETGNYEAFLKMDVPEQMVERHNSVTKEQFDKMVEAHDLRESGDYQGAREIMESLGFDNMKGMEGERGMGMNRS